MILKLYRLKDHIERKHENGAYPCELCGYIAISSRTLIRHKVTFKILDCTLPTFDEKR